MARKQYGTPYLAGTITSTANSLGWLTTDTGADNGQNYAQGVNVGAVYTTADGVPRSFPNSAIVLDPGASGSIAFSVWDSMTAGFSNWTYKPNTWVQGDWTFFLTLCKVQFQAGTIGGDIYFPSAGGRTVSATIELLVAPNSWVTVGTVADLPGAWTNYTFTLPGASAPTTAQSLVSGLGGEVAMRVSFSTSSGSATVIRGGGWRAFLVTIPPTATRLVNS